MAQLQGQVTSFADVQAQPNYQNLPTETQAAIAADFFDKRVASQPGYQKAPAQAQQAMKQDFMVKYNVPIGNAPSYKPPPVTMEKSANPVIDWLGKQYQAAQNDYLMQTGDMAYGLKNASLGYVDMTKGFQGDTAGADPYQQARRAASGAVGSILPYVGAEGLFSSGLKSLGRSLLPLTGEASSVGQLARPAMEAVSRLQGPSMLARMARNAIPFGAVGAAESQPGHQMDIGRRTAAGGLAAASGAVFPPLETVGGKLLKGGVEMFLPSSTPITATTRPASEVIQAIAKKQRIQRLMSQPVYRAKAEALLKELQALKQEAAPLIQNRADNHIAKVEAFLKGEGELLPEEMRQSRGFVQNAPRIGQFKKESAIVQKAKAELKNRATNQNTEVEPKGATEQEATQPQKETLKGFVPSKRSGSTALGVVPDLVGPNGKVLKGAVVRMQEGHRGVGAIKIINRHNEELKMVGFDKDPAGFVEWVMQHPERRFFWSQAHKGVTVVVPTGNKKIPQIGLELLKDSNGEFHNVKTAGVFVKSRLEKQTELKVVPSDNSSTRSGTSAFNSDSLETPGAVTQQGNRDLSSNPKDSTTQNTPQPPKQLTGSVKEMVQKVAESANLPANAGEMTAGQLEAQIGRKLSEGEKGIHTSLRAIARTDVVDAERGIHKQLGVESAQNLKFDAVKDSISPEYQKTATIIDDAMAQGKAVRLEYAAEESGRSNEAAKLTNAGNVKVETTTFTPLYWSKTKDGKVLLKGYNQRGHFSTYHLEPSLNGSQVLKAGKITDKPFVGEYANIYLGQRPFLVKDVLSRGVRSETGPIKTSEAKALLEHAASNLDEVFKLIDSGKINAVSNQALKELRDTPQWGMKELRKFQKLLQNKQLRNEVCTLLGLVHP